jgi:two-component system, chemotaxis family, sensor kinase Cph1
MMSSPKSALREDGTRPSPGHLSFARTPDLAPGPSSAENDQRALLNILEDFAAEKSRLESGQRAILNILDDFDAERARMEGTQRATLNILEDFAAEKTQLEATHGAMVNILGDFSEEKGRLEETQRAAWNILDDFDKEKSKVELANRQLEIEIEERKRTGEQLRRASLYSRSLLEASLDPLVTISREGKITDVNQGTEFVTGAARQQLIGSDFSIYFTEPEEARKGYEQVFAQGSVRDYPLAIRHASGRITEVLYNATLFKSESGQVEGVFAAARDITERKRAEEKLRQSEAELKEAQRVAHVGSWHLVPETGTINWTEEIFQIFGVDPKLPAPMYEQLKGLLTPESWAQMDAAIAMTRQTGKPYEIELEVVRPDASRRWIMARGEALRDPGGEVVALRGICQDITERKQAEEELARRAEELARSNAELQQFAYVASHDLQEPLRMVASFTQLLAQRYEGKLGADADEFIGYAVGGARRMQVLVNDLLAYSRVGTRGKEFAGVDCEKVMETVLANLQKALEESGGQVTHDPLPTVQGDETQLGQVLQNLVGNALKFHGSEPPRVHVSAQQIKGEWRFTVHDNGIGIDPQHAERIFLLFQRLHTLAEYPGTGMGLAITKKIVERHGGRVWVESEPGKGSSFYFSIPMKGVTHADAFRASATG